MKNQLQILRSKINLLNGQLAGIHDSHLFSPEEKAELTAPLVAQVLELNEQLLSVHADGAEERNYSKPNALTPLKEQGTYGLR